YCNTLFFIIHPFKTGKLLIMKFSLVPFLFIINFCFGQQWQAEVMVGVSGYNGDLTQKRLSFKTLKPAVNLNVKYDVDNRLILRAGIAWATVTANDKNNAQADLKMRNLNFQSTLLEGSLCAEVNVFEPGIFYSYPYLFGGIGVFHFNPFTYDKENKKTYLHPLSTEGQGLPEYPRRKIYNLTQFCLPFGGGWKININEKWDIIYEIGARILFTDYLDDVSTSYVNPQTLLMHKGEKAVELAFRQEPASGSNLPLGGETRGNPGVKDWYFFNGIKLLVHLGKDE
ncbi:MAG: DUF6089 family protein, partial [Ginsengibacter sp.]